MKLTLDKSKWICGEPLMNKNKNNCLGEGDTMLENSKGFMCCLGQFSRQLGYKGSIKHAGNPASTMDEIDLLTYSQGKTYKKYYNTDFSKKAMNINDNEQTTVEEKIKLLTELCAENGIELTVIN